MHKAELLNLINDYVDKKVALREEEDPRIKLLIDYLKLIQYEDDINFNDFYSSLNPEVKKYFYDFPDEATRDFFEIFILASSFDPHEFKKLKTSHKPNDLLPNNVNWLELLPIDLRRDLANKFLDPKSKARLSQTSQAFYKESISIEYWKDDLINLGLNKDLLKTMYESKYLENYKNLYHKFTYLSPVERKKINESWQLICLSGDLNKIQNAIKNGLLRGDDSVKETGLNPLHLIALSGNVKAIPLAMDLGIEPDQETENGENILHLAVRKGDLDMIEYILSLDRIDTTLKTASGENILHIAARYGHANVMRYIIENNQDFRIDIQALTDDDEVNANILHLAILSGDLDTIKFVLNLKEGKNLDADENKDLAESESQEENETSLIDPRTNTADDENIFHLAVQSGNIDVLKFFIKDLTYYSTQLEIDPSDVTRGGQNALHIAASMGNVEMMKLIVDRLKLDPQETTDHGLTILHLAAKSGNVEAMQFALQLNSDPAVTDDKGMNFVHYAALSGHLEALAFALQAASDKGVDINAADKFGNTALHFSAISGNPSCIKLSIDKTHLDPQTKNTIEQTALHLAAKNGHEKAIVCLREFGLDPTTKDKKGNDAFWYGEKSEKPEETKLALNKNLTTSTQSMRHSRE